MFTYIGYTLCYMPESEICVHICAYRLGSPWAHSPCGPCKDVGHRCGGCMWHEVAVVGGNTQLFPEHMYMGAGVSLKEGCRFGGC